MNFQEFTANDIAFLPEMEPEGWGDLRPRFEYFLRSGHCRPIKIEEHGKPVAVGTTISHKNSVWLACIITHPEHRNKGLGSAITRALVNSVDRGQYPTISLDATEFGFPVYLKQGFEVEGQYGHFRREGEFKAVPQPTAVGPFSEEFREAAYALDQLVCGEDRHGVMAEFLNDAHVYVDEAGELKGIYLPSWSDGPVMAVTDEAGFALLQLRMISRPVAILPMGNTSAIQYLQENGYKLYRTSRRMVLGPRLSWHPEYAYNRISGALG